MTKKGRAFDVKLAGVAVHVVLDVDGPPLLATAAEWGDEGLRLASLAAQHVFDKTQHAAESTKRKRDSNNAAAQSAQKRAEASANHWTNKWFADAHAAHPQYGKDRLAQRARALAAAADDKAKKPEDKIPAKKRDEITVERARAFLKRERNAPQQ